MTKDDHNAVNEIDPIDQEILSAAFNSNGYVLNFTDATFANFTIKSIGISVQEKYKLSKARSLAKFTCEGETAKVVKLYSDLIKYFETKWADEIEKKTDQANRILALKPILARYTERGCFRPHMPAIESSGSLYVRDLAERAFRDVGNGEFDSALTKAKTLLEETFCHVLEGKGIIKNKNGDINDLYNEVKKVCGMKQTPEYDKRVNELLSGLEKILKAVSEMRNAQSDAHGVGRKRLRVAEHHARLFVNASLIMAEFILSVGER